MRGTSIESPSPSDSGIALSESDYASEVTSRRGGTKKIYTQVWPPLTSPANDTASGSLIRVADRDEYATPWTAGNTAKALFKHAQPTPPQQDSQALVKQQSDVVTSDGSKNMFKVRFWDPASPDYQPDIFLDPVIEKYCCPFSLCIDDVSYDTLSELEDHLRGFHLQIRHRCPGCLRIFNSGAGLIGHCESTSRCRIRDSDKFLQVSVTAFFVIESC